MIRLIALTAMMTLVIARPETYREQEDFQYSRSSSDDGTKSGFYGARRGNMGGNYERAHNMDNLAQHQMSGLVRQINGELGDGAKTKTGSVYSSANSRGTYGSGKLDSSNLEGRNFQEGTSYDSSQSLTHSSSARNSAGYTNAKSQSYGGYQNLASDAQTHLDNLQSLDNHQQHNYGSSRRSSGYQSQSGFEERRHYDSGSNSNSDYGSTQYTSIPVRIIVTPGRRVAVPVTSVYDNEHGPVINHNTLNSDLESTSDIHQSSVSRPTNTKYYESSYRYNKNWEKHDTIPTSVSVVVPTESPIPKNSELYEDIDVHRFDNQNNARGAVYQNAHSSATSGKYNAAHTSSQSGYQSNYNTQYRGDSLNTNTRAGYGAHGVSSDSSNAYTQTQHDRESRYGVSVDSNLNSNTRHGADTQLNVNSQVEDLNTRPKSYQSSYSYHKSWERQGDPYVIKPASNGYYDNQASQGLSSSTKNLAYTTYQPGNCDVNCHIRVARSYGTNNQAMEQQSQSLDNDQQLSQQVQGTWRDVENLSQQSQSNWEQQNAGQQTQNRWDNVEDFGQQSQGNWDQQNVGQESEGHWDKLEDLSQQSQSNWNQQSFGQQSQSQWDKLDNLSQQTQNNWDQQHVGQQNEQQGSGFENLAQEQQNVGLQSQGHWDKLEDLSQQSQSNWDQQSFGKQSLNQWDKLDNLSQQTQSNWDQQHVGQQNEQQGSGLENLAQEPQNNVDQQNVGQQSQGHWDKLEDLSQQSQSNWDQQNNGQLSEKQGKSLENLDQQIQDSGNQQNIVQQSQGHWDKLEDLNQQSQSNWDQIKVGQQHKNNWDKIEQLSQQPLSTWGKSEDLTQTHGQKAQNKQDIKHKQESKYEHRLEIIQPNIRVEYSQTINGQEHGKKLDIPWDAFNRFDSNKEYEQTQHYKENNTEFQTFISEDTNFKHQTDSQLYKENFHNNAIVTPHQKKSNDNTDYNYSSGFVNPFFNQNHNNQLANSDNSYTANSENFGGNIWNSHIYSNSPSDANWKKVNISQTNIEQNPLTHIWVRLDKFNQASELSTFNNITDIYLTNKSDNTNKTISENSADTSTNMSSMSEGYQKNAFHPVTSKMYTELDKVKTIATDLLTIQSDKPETLRDVGRGDIGPNGVIDVNHSHSTVLIPQNTNNNFIKQDSAIQVVENNETPLEHDSLDGLSVISLEQQKEAKSIADSHINERTLDVSSNNKKHINLEYNNTYLHNLNHNKTAIVNQSNTGRQGIAIQNDINFEQMSVAQESLHQYGQENTQIFTQQHDNQQQDFSNLHKTSQNFSLEEQYLQRFGLGQVTDADQSTKNFDVVNVQTVQQNNLYQQKGRSFRQDYGQDIKKQLEHTLGHNVDAYHSKNNQSINPIHTYESFDKDLKIDIKQTNLSRVQKSVRKSNLNKVDPPHDHELSNPTEYYYAGDYEPGMNSNEHDFDHDLNMQYQVYRSYSHDSEHQSGKKLSQDDTQIDLQDSVTFTTTTISASTTQNSKIQQNITAKPGFWKAVGNKFVTAKDTVVSWFKSMG